jgi:hypothetical protein
MKDDTATRHARDERPRVPDISWDRNRTFRQYDVRRRLEPRERPNLDTRGNQVFHNSASHEPRTSGDENRVAVRPCS